VAAATVIAAGTARTAHEAKENRAAMRAANRCSVIEKLPEESLCAPLDAARADSA
jgi:hypothetical protein